LKEFYQILRVLSLQRIWNLFLVYKSYLFSNITNKPFVWAYPFSISIEPTTQCNLNCPECPTGNNSLTRKMGKMDFELFKIIIDQVYKKTFYLNLFLQGEPFLHPELCIFASYARSKKMFVTISTNGHFLDSDTCEKIIHSGIQKIIISLDGASKESYNKYRSGGDFEKVKEGIKLLSDTKNKNHSYHPHIVIQMLVHSFNEHEIPEMQTLVKNLGADKLELKSMQIYHKPEFLPKLEKHNRYKLDKNNHLVSKNKLHNNCFRLWSTAVFTFEGDLIACCYDKNATHRFGNMVNSEFKKLWKNKLFNDYRSEVLTHRKNIEICNNCLE
jgi:MoaA/NifB/PqqE/SkfB family radical SAM enzyme